MKRYFLLLLLSLSFSAYSQNTLNNYKYVLVPGKYSFLKQKDQYSLNSLTKALLEFKGFTVYFDNAELPTEVANNKCLALSADVLDNSGAFTTSLTLVLKDCQGNIVFKSKAGTSREKEYKTAYNLALRDAFTSLDDVQYAYNGSTDQPASTTPPAAVAKPAATALTEPVKTAGTVANNTVRPITAPATPVKPTDTASAVPVKATEVVSNQPAATLFARATANGYQLVDSTQKTVLTLLKTSAENYFIANNATVNGIVLKKNEGWFFEYYKDGKLVSEKLVVSF